jgi:hypothetical protein
LHRDPQCTVLSKGLPTYYEAYHDQIKEHRVKEQYIISQLELLDLDSLVVPPFCSFLI